MRNIYYNFILVLSLIFFLFSFSICSASNFWPFSKIEEGKTDLIDKISIDKVLHKWDLENNTDPLTIVVFLRNISNENVEGEIVFKVSLDKSGLEEETINKLIKLLGEQGIISYANKVNSPKFVAMANYIKRGKKLAENSEFEEVAVLKNSNNVYFFKFKRNINVAAGQIIKIEHKQVIPLSVAGHLFSIDVEKIE